jgi:hypothetical protein
MALIAFGILSAAAGKALRVAVAGYIGGGETSSGTPTTVNKWAFPADTRTTLGTGLSGSSPFGMGFANSGVAGYFSVGGSSIDKFAFPSDSRTTLGSGLSINRSSLAGFANSAVAGYALGGSIWTGSSTLRYTTVDKWAFPADTRTTLSPGLATATDSQTGMANFGVAGYSAGGNDGSRISSVRKFAFPSDTQSNLATGLSNAVSEPAGMANQSVAGYVSGGGFPIIGTVDKFAFPSDTKSTLGTGLSQVRRGHAGFANSGIAGYFGGGNDDSTGTRLSSVDKFDFTNDSRSTLASGLSVATIWVSGFSNEGVF